MSLDIREGWTERIKYALTINDGTVLDMTGFTVALVGVDRALTALVFSGSVGIETAALGVVYFDPAVTDLSASNSPYRLRWKVTDTSGKIAYFPRTEPLTWNIETP